MRFIECEQGGEAWLAARVGVITASRFKDATDRLKRGKPSQKLTDYAYDLAIERISGERSDDVFITKAMRDGTEREPYARMEYEMATGNVATESGILLSDDGRFGYSADGMVGDDGLIEIKCLSSSRKIVEMWATGDTSDYMAQMQGGMWLTGRQWCDFIMYCPQLESVGKSMFLKRIGRDEAYIEEMARGLQEFAEMVDQFEAKLREQAA